MSKIKNLITAAGLAVGLLGYEAGVEAKPVSVNLLQTMKSDSLTRHDKMEIISQRHFGTNYGNISRERKVGVSWAADKATVKFDPRCNGHQLVWDDDHIRWGMDWQRRQDRRKASVTATGTSGRGGGKGSSTTTYDDRPASVNNDYSINNSFNVQVTVYKTDDGRLYMIEKRLDDDGKVIEQSRKRISILEGKVEESERELTSLKQGSKPYEPKSEVSTYGGFLDERMGGKSFSRGYLVGVNALLRKKFSDGKVGQLELKVGGLHSDYTQTSGDVTVFYGRAGGLLGVRRKAGRVAYEVLGGLGVDVTGGQDSYGGFNTGFTEGKALVYGKARVDSKHVSAEARAAVGGGAQTIKGAGVDFTSPLSWAEGSVTGEVHAGPVDITGTVGATHTRLNVDGVARDHTDAYGEGCIDVALGKGVDVGFCVKGGQQTDDQGRSTYAQGIVKLGGKF